MQEVEKKIEELTLAGAEMKKEIGQRQMEAKHLKEDLDNKNRIVQKDHKQLEITLEDVEKFKVCHQSLS